MNHIYSSFVVSSSGKQVIALGIITALLVALYYSLTLFHWINKKRREPTKDKATYVKHQKICPHLSFRTLIVAPGLNLEFFLYCFFFLTVQ